MASGTFGWCIEQPQRTVLRSRGQWVAIGLTFGTAAPFPPAGTEPGAEEFHRRVGDRLAAAGPAANVQQIVAGTLRELAGEADQRLQAALADLETAAGPHLDRVATAIAERSCAQQHPSILAARLAGRQ